MADKIGIAGAQDIKLFSDDKTINELHNVITPYSIPKGTIFDISLPGIPILVFCLVQIIAAFETSNRPLLMGILFALTIISLLALITVPLLTNMTTLLEEEYEKIGAYITQKVNNNCKQCIALKKFNTLNSYNIFTYDQILQIEKNVGEYALSTDKAIYIYSTYRDEGEMGYPGANEVMELNKKRSVMYYEIFYKNSQESLATKDSIAEELNNEILIDLSKLIIGEENLSKCLDYQFYQHSRFDIMIYQWDINRIDGYFCLNFPIIGLCRSYVDSSECPMNCTLGNADRMYKVFYKKMPNAITQSLHSRLKQFVQSNKN